MMVSEPFFKVRVGGVDVHFTKCPTGYLEPPHVNIEDVNKALGTPFETLEAQLKEFGLLPQDPIIPGVGRFYTTVDMKLALNLIGGSIVMADIPLETAYACVDAISKATRYWLSTLEPNKVE